MKHEFSLLWRVMKKSMDKNGTDAKYVDDQHGRSLATRHSFALRKEKVSTLAGSGEFVVVKAPIPELGLEKGMIDDFSTTLKIGKELGVITKDEKEKVWRLKVDGKSMKVQKQDDLKLFWKKNFGMYLDTQQEIIRVAKSSKNGGM